MLALVTGASSGIGKALCVALAEKQIPLILVARNKERLEETAQKLPVKTTVFPADLSKSEDLNNLTAFVREKQPDLLINNAGFGLYGPTLAHPYADLKEMVDLNILALMQLTYVAAHALLHAKKRGTIVNVSSAAAYFSYPTFSVYAATKAFVNRFSEALDAELHGSGIRVLTVCPGQVATNFRARASGNTPQQSDWITMPAEKAAQLILSQIASGKRLNIIDWRYKLSVAIGRLIPPLLTQALLKNRIRNRHHFKLK